MAEAVISVTIDSTGAQRGAREVNRALSDTQRQAAGAHQETGRLESGFGRLRQSATSLRTAMTALAGAIAALGLGKLARDALGTAESIDDFRQQTGIAAESIQGLNEMAERFGSSASEMEGGLRRFNRRIGLATEGTGAAANAVERMGIALEDASGQARATEDVLRDVMDHIADIESQSQRAALASEFFGDQAGPQLAEALGQGSQGLDQMIRRLSETGRLMDQDVVQRAGQASQQLSEMRRAAVQAFQVGVIEGFADEIGNSEEAIEQIAEAASTMGEAVGSAFSWATENAEDLIDRLDTIAEIMVTIGGAWAGAKIGRAGGIWGSLGGAAIGGLGAWGAMQMPWRGDEDDTATTAPAGPAPTPGETQDGPPTVDITSPPWQQNIDQIGRQIDEQHRLNAAIAESEQRHRAVQQAMEREEQIREFMAEHELERNHAATQQFEEMLRHSQALESEYQDVIDKQRRSQEAARDLGFTFSSAFEDAIVQGENLRGILQGLADDILRIALRMSVTQPMGEGLADMFSGMFSGGGGGGYNLSAGLVPRASGGPVHSGQSYLVGDAGPEILHMGGGQTGNVTPNHQIGGDLEVNVYNQGQPVDADVRARSGGGRRVVDVMLNAVADDIRRNGKVGKAITGSTSAKSRTATR